MNERSDVKVFVGGLSPSVTEYALALAFSGYGRIVESKVVLDKGTGRPKGFGFVTFADRDSALRAALVEHPLIEGKPANVSLASAPKGTGKTTFSDHFGSAPGLESSSAKRPRLDLPYLEQLAASGEDVRPSAIETHMLQLAQEQPPLALLYFLERAEAFRGTPDLDHWMAVMVSLAREFRRTGVIGSLPEKGSAEATAMKQERALALEAEAETKPDEHD